MARAPCPLSSSPPLPARWPRWSRARGHALFRLRNPSEANPRICPSRTLESTPLPGSARKGLYYAWTANEIPNNHHCHGAGSRQASPACGKTPKIPRTAPPAPGPILRCSLPQKGSRALARRPACSTECATRGAEAEAGTGHRRSSAPVSEKPGRKGCRSWAAQEKQEAS